MHDLDSRRTDWLGPLKGIAIGWIFLNHLVERIFGFPYISNPSPSWPPFDERLAQLNPIDYGSLVHDLLLNVIRYLGWSGDQGVQLFLIASGFGLMWSVKRRGEVEPYRDFLTRRVWRIYPMWWGAHILFLLLSVFVGRYGMQPFDPRFYLSLVGFRASPTMIYYFAPAWWYIGLILQLYLVFPILARFLRRSGPVRFLVWTLGVSFAVRLAGLYWFQGYLDPWSRGAIFITRLPEFALGMAVAWWMYDDPKTSSRVLKSPVVVAGAVVAYVVATGLALTLWGMTIAPFFHGAAAFVVLYGVIVRIVDWKSRFATALAWLGGISYSLYLMHHPVTAFLIERRETPSLGAVAFGVPVFAVSVVASLFLERVVDWCQKVVTAHYRARGFVWILVPVLIAAVLGVGLLVSAEIAVRHFSPKEANGWGERPSLEPHPEFGWRMIPDQETRLRWESYDYVVEANGLGFPGPMYPITRVPNSIRILTLGDAFTSAEGVDSREAWPRVLERVLGDRIPNTQIEVLNFAITGHGPNQYSAVFQEYGPQYRPDIVIVGFFVNEFFDALVSNDSFQAEIGFGLPPQDGVGSYIEAAHARKFIQHEVTDPIREWVTRVPNANGYFLGNFRSFDSGLEAQMLEGAGVVERRLREIKATADDVGAEVFAVLIPASIQICGPEDLSYYPQFVDILDEQTFDLDRPQELALEINDQLGIITFDLRAPLQEMDECPYQPRNMHWLPEGHHAVASFLADRIVDGGYVAVPVEPQGVGP